jgi:hypothetical protein
MTDSDEHQSISMDGFILSARSLAISNKAGNFAGRVIHEALGNHMTIAGTLHLHRITRGECALYANDPDGQQACSAFSKGSYCAIIHQ